MASNPFENEETFNSWKHNPLTRSYRRFLLDWRNDIKEAWAAGERLPDNAQAMAMVLGDLANLEWNRDVVPVYETEEKETDDAEETKEGA